MSPGCSLIRRCPQGSLGEGYYPGVSALPGSTSLAVPCRLGEVELALAMEMFVTVNASAILSLAEMGEPSLTITLKRYPRPTIAAFTWLVTLRNLWLKCFDVGGFSSHIDLEDCLQSVMATPSLPFAHRRM